jgi:hypothetical protein
VRFGINLEKSFNNGLSSVYFRLRGRWSKINKKIAALTLLTLTAFAAVIGGLMMTAQATDTNSTTTIDTSTSITVDSDSSAGGKQIWDIGSLMTEGGGGHRWRRGHELGPLGKIEVSPEYTASVNAILEADADVQGLISEGYNVTSLNPIIRKFIESDGAVATKATTALVILQNGTSGYATVSVDVENAKVSEIVIITRTVIDKSTS